MFLNRAHGGLNMVYRRNDGNIGWVDPGLEAAYARNSPAFLSFATRPLPAGGVS